MKRALAFLAALALNSSAFANFSMSPSGGTTAFAIDGANQGTSLCAAASTECGASVPINTAGAPLFTSGVPGLVTLTGTNAVNATLQPTATTAIGKVDPNTIGTWGLATVGLGSAPANALIGGLVCNNGTLTPTSGQSSALQGDANCNLLVKVANTTTALPSNADGVAVQTGAANSPVNDYPYVFNGTTWDRVRTFSGLTGVAPPAGGVYLASLGSGATGGLLAGLISCDQHGFKHITSATDTVAVQGTASQSIYVCMWRARAAGVATWYFEVEADANNNCSNLGAQMNGIATEAANTGETLGSNFWSGMKTPVGQGMCIKSTGTGGVDIDFWYAKL